jgi:branched-chain amino acid transport system substrate-binding protein
VRRLAISVVGLLILGGACTPIAGQQSPKQGSDIKVGIPLAATGAAVQEAGLTKQGYDLWADWANRSGGIVVQGVRHRVRLLYRDDASNPQVSAQLAQQMITRNKVQFMLGPYGTTNTAAAAAVAEKYRVPLVASNAAARQIFTQGFRYLFGVVASGDQYPHALIDMVLTENPRPSTVAVLAADDVFSQAAAKATVDYAVSKGLKIVFFQTYPTGLTNFDPLIQQAKTRNPDMLFNLGHLLDSVAVHKAAMDLQLNAKLFAYAVGPGEPPFVQALGKSADYVVTVSPWTAQALVLPLFGAVRGRLPEEIQDRPGAELPGGGRDRGRRRPPERDRACQEPQPREGPERAGLARHRHLLRADPLRCPGRELLPVDPGRADTERPAADRLAAGAGQLDAGIPDPNVGGAPGHPGGAAEGEAARNRGPSNPGLTTFTRPARSPRGAGPAGIPTPTCR